MEEYIRMFITDVNKYAIEVRHQIHENPELGFQEYKTTALIKSELAKNGIETKPLAMETGVLAIIKGEVPWEGPGNSPVIGIRADMDALPIEENTGKPYSSKIPGIMHACGHDGHTAILLGTAVILQKLRGHIAGTVKLFFQPAEETLQSGAKRMLACGVLENPPVDRLIALHAAIDVPLGSIGVYSGPFMASADAFEVRMVGKGTHGATPFRGTDALSAAAQAALSLQMILAREIDAHDRAVLSVCKIHGGEAFNVVPAEVSIAGTVRCYSEDVRNKIADRIKAICEGIAQTYMCIAQVEYRRGLPATVNDAAVTEQIAQAAEKAIGAERLIRLPNPLMGSEDFSIFAQKVPSSIFRLGVAEDTPMSLHNPGFDFVDGALEIGMSIFVQYVLDQLQPYGNS